MELGVLLAIIFGGVSLLIKGTSTALRSLLFQSIIFWLKKQI